MGHVVLGAINVASAGFAMMWSVDVFGLRAIIVYGVLAVIGGLTVLAGLWIRDGAPRGAMLAAALDVGRVALLVLGASSAKLMDVVVTVGALAGALWILPELRAERAAQAERARRG